MMNSKTSLQIVTISLIKACGAILGLCAALLMAYLFGASATTDSYFMARRIVSGLATGLERMFHLIYVPGMVRALTFAGKSKFRRLMDKRLMWTTGVAGIVTVCAIMAAPLVIALIAPGFDEKRQRDATVILQILMISVPMSAFSALAGAALNAIRIFSLPTLARLMPRVFVLVVLVVIPIGDFSVIAWAVVVGSSAMGLILGIAYNLKLRGAEERYEGSLFTERLGGSRERLIAMLVAQLHMIASGWIDFAYGSIVGIGAVAVLEFADRLTNSAPGVVSNSVATVYYTEFSHATGADALKLRQVAIAESLRITLVFVAPVAVTLATCADIIVEVMFAHGAFSRTAADATTLVVTVLAPVLLIHAVSSVLAGALFADNRLPHLKIILTSVTLALVVKVGSNFLLIGSVGLMSIPIAVLFSESALLVAIYGWEWRLRGNPITRATMLECLKIAISCGAAGGTVMLLRSIALPDITGASPIGQAFGLLLTLGCGGLVLVSVAVMLNVREAILLRSFIFRFVQSDHPGAST